MSSTKRSLPGVGDVIRYAYLWSDEYDSGREDGTKDRPTAVVAVVRTTAGRDEVAVLAVTSAATSEDGAGVEIPA